MKINWKDIGMMYAILYVMLILLAAIGSYLHPPTVTEPGLLIMPSIWDHLSGILALFLVFAIPLGYYFWRNKCSILEAAGLSFVLGFTSLTPVPFLMIFLHSLLRSPSDPVVLWHVDFLSLAIIFTIFGIMSTVTGLIVWFIIDKLKWEKY